MIHHALYDPATGLFVGRTFSTNMADPAARERAVIMNTPTGLAAAEGLFDHLSQRVDLDALATAQQARSDLRANAEQVVDYQPPQPSADHEWNTATRRWQLTSAAQQRQAARENAMARITAIEAAQHRPMRELAIDPSNADALKRLHDMESEIALLRKAIG